VSTTIFIRVEWYNCDDRYYRYIRTMWRLYADVTTTLADGARSRDKALFLYSLGAHEWRRPLYGGEWENCKIGK